MIRRLRAWYWNHYINRLRERALCAILCGDIPAYMVYAELLNAAVAKRRAWLVA